MPLHITKHIPNDSMRSRLSQPLQLDPVTLWFTFTESRMDRESRMVLKGNLQIENLQIHRGFQNIGGLWIIISRISVYGMCLYALLGDHLPDWLRAVVSWTVCVSTYRLWMLWYIMSQRFSIVLRSGECEGQSIAMPLLSRNTLEPRAHCTTMSMTTAWRILSLEGVGVLLASTWRSVQPSKDVLC